VEATDRVEVVFGVLPLTFVEPGDYEAFEQDDVLKIVGLHDALQRGREITVRVGSKGREVKGHDLSPRQRDLLLAGGVINWMRTRPG
jgi:aconitate hydratase